MKITSRQADPTGNTIWAIIKGSYSADSFEIAESSVLRMNICAEKPAHRQSAKGHHQG